MEKKNNEEWQDQGIGQQSTNTISHTEQRRTYNQEGLPQHANTNITVCPQVSRKDNTYQQQQQNSNSSYTRCSGSTQGQQSDYYWPPSQPTAPPIFPETHHQDPFLLETRKMIQDQNTTNVWTHQHNNNPYIQTIPMQQVAAC